MLLSEILSEYTVPARDPAAQMSGLPVSVYVITLNEEKNIDRLLDQLSGFKEVIIVDSGSKDATRNIAGSYPNVKFYFRSWTGFSDQKAYALSLCTQNWVLNLDADEELTPPYLAEMRSLLEQTEYSALESNRRLLRWGRPSNSFVKDDRLIRFFRKEHGRYEFARVHERITVSGRVKQSDVQLLHHENLSFSERIAKSNQYSRLKALDKLDKNRKCNPAILVVIFQWSFLQCYLGKGYFLDGVEGLLVSMNHAFYNFMKYAKLWEYQQNSELLSKSVLTAGGEPP